VTTPGPPCDVLDWDSQFFGHAIARARASRLDDAACREMLDWCRAHGTECLYVLADEDHPGTLRLLDAAGFRQVDRRVTLERTLDPDVGPAPAGTRAAREEDIPALRAIAAVSHRNGRFHVDGRFDSERCDEFYRVWIENSCHGWADHVVVAEREGRAVGYLTAHLKGPDTGSLGLMGVDTAIRRHGLGGQLLQGALAWLAGRSITRVWLATQGRNDASQGFFTSAGFRPTHAALWYHRWFDEPPDAAR
jgi:N-acetylglutamate synthase-like GNAT family acetyltransferase